MRIPSRRMLQRPATGWLGMAVFLGFLALSLGALAVPGLLWWPLSFVLPALFFLKTAISWLRDRQVAKIRRGESICEFARSFDYRSIDTWIIRAVYQELSEQFPIRASDRLENDLHIDGEDLDDTCRLIARRSGRSLQRWEDNPLFGSVRTVRDLVLFLHHQPPAHQQA